MARHQNTIGITIKDKKAPRESSTQRHRQIVAVSRAASTEIEQGKCPNDQAQLVDGRCSRCDFHLTVLPPMRVANGVHFNRAAYRDPHKPLAVALIL